MTVILLIGAMAVAWGGWLTAAYLYGRRVRTHRIETLRPLPPLPEPCLHGQPPGRHPGQDHLRRARRTGHAYGEAPWRS